MSIAFEKLHKAKTNQSVLGISISIIASTIIVIPHRIPKIPPIKLIIFSCGFLLQIPIYCAAGLPGKPTCGIWNRPVWPLPGTAAPAP